MRRWLSLLCAVVAVLFCTPFAAQASSEPIIDKVLVEKSERRLHLMHRGKVIKSYRVSLGKQPKGAKVREGDMRTPEGFYWIDWRKTSEKFNLSMHISYPNSRDRARAEARCTGRRHDHAAWHAVG